jgi:hypothetical protein
MIIFKDVLTGDEMFSDIYTYKIIDDCVYEVEGKMTTEKDEIDESKLGANASAEGEDADAGGDTTSKSGCNIVLANRLTETGFGGKKEYQVYLKGYMAAVIKRLEEVDAARIPIFKAAIAKYVKDKVLPNFKNWQFFQGEKQDPDGMCALLDFREDGTTPYMIFFKDGIEEEKV